MFAKASWLCFLAAATLLVRAALWFITTAEEWDIGNVLIVEQMQHDLGEQSLGPHMLEVRVHNTGSRPYQILGAPNG